MNTIQNNPTTADSTVSDQNGASEPNGSQAKMPVSAMLMASAPIVYGEDGAVAWNQMWDSYCVLASAGGPPHRGQMLFAPRMEDPTSPAYQKVCEELIRGILL